MPAKTKSVQIVTRVEPEVAERIEALKGKLAMPGLALTAADVTRMAIALGLDALEARAKVGKR
jgi:hypothetical protein